MPGLVVGIAKTLFASCTAWIRSPGTDRRAAADRLQANQEPGTARTAAMELALIFHSHRCILVTTTVAVPSSGQCAEPIVPARRLLLNDPWCFRTNVSYSDEGIKDHNVDA